MHCEQKYRHTHMHVCVCVSIYLFILYSIIYCYTYLIKDLGTSFQNLTRHFNYKVSCLPFSLAAQSHHFNHISSDLVPDSGQTLTFYLEFSFFFSVSILFLTNRAETSELVCPNLMPIFDGGLISALLHLHTPTMCPAARC